MDGVDNVDGGFIDIVPWRGRREGSKTRSKLSKVRTDNFTG